MRKINLFLVIGMMITFVIHGIMGSMKLMGADANALKNIAFISIMFICLHIIVTCVLTFETLKVRKLSGAGYFKDNLMFWTRRISGLTIIIPLVMHLLIFSGTENNGTFRLVEFTAGRLASQIMLIITIAFHVLINLEPAMISFGVKSTKAFSHDAMFVLSMILLLFCTAFAVYYIRWISV